MQTEIYQVDAFTDKIFGGNPAAVCPLDEWLPDTTLQNIAMENNLSETAFFVPSKGNETDFDIRFFTPTTEIALCGHATLATAFTLFEHLKFHKNTIKFSSQSAKLETTKKEKGYTLNFPIWYAEKKPHTKEQIEDILGTKILEIHQSTKTFAILADAQTVQTLKPDFSKIKTLKNTKGLVITAAGGQKTDFTSRLFAPQIGIDEDPVTGAIHCFLIPFWSKRLNKTKLNAHQASARGGELVCELKGDRVEITGQAALYLKGTIYV